MNNELKEQEMNQNLNLMEFEEQGIYDRFREMFGIDFADDMPSTANEVENYFYAMLYQCGMQVDAHMVVCIIYAIDRWREAEKRFDSASRATPDNIDVWIEKHGYFE